MARMADLLGFNGVERARQARLDLSGAVFEEPPVPLATGATTGRFSAAEPNLSVLDKSDDGHGGDPSLPDAHGMLVLAGAIKWWWDIDPATGKERWGGPEHQAYTYWRDEVRRAMVDLGFLTYAPHAAFKGPWNPAAQAVNNAAIRSSSGMIVLSRPEWVTEGTDEEVGIAIEAGVPVFYLYAPTMRTALRDYTRLAVLKAEGVRDTLSDLAA